MFEWKFCTDILSRNRVNTKNMDIKKHELLDKIMSQVIDWLKFAEAKNGALIAFGGVIIFSVMRLMGTTTDIGGMLLFYVICLVFLVIVAVILSLASFIPRLTTPFWIKMPETLVADNPLYFAHACKYSKSGYLKLLNKSCGLQESDDELIDLLLCDQIVNNSKIAFIKYQIFDLSLKLFLAGVLTPVGAYVLYRVRN